MEKWSSEQDSNLWPAVYKTAALPTELPEQELGQCTTVTTKQLTSDSPQRTDRACRERTVSGLQVQGDHEGPAGTRSAAACGVTCGVTPQVVLRGVLRGRDFCFVSRDSSSPDEPSKNLPARKIMSPRGGRWRAGSIQGVPGVGRQGVSWGPGYPGCLGHSGPSC
jgi:hypothetical protein